MVLGGVNVYDALSHPAGIFEVQPKSVACLYPNQFTKFSVILHLTWIMFQKDCYTFCGFKQY
ncbi:hypothetical protein ACHQM5_003081 [Ranunculus cassubicifolius]